MVNEVVWNIVPQSRPSIVQVIGVLKSHSRYHPLQIRPNLLDWRHIRTLRRPFEHLHVWFKQLPGADVWGLSSGKRNFTAQSTSRGAE
jgi:hypothetical protein